MDLKLDEKKYRVVSWEELDRVTREMGKEIGKEHEKEPFDLMVVIMRGGAVVGRILSDQLSLRMVSVGIESYVGVETQKGLKFYEELAVPVEGKKVLLVDEICDTGRTFLAALGHVGEGHPRQVMTASTVYKPQSEFRPDYIGITDDRWVVFPYEQEEFVRVAGE